MANHITINVYEQKVRELIFVLEGKKSTASYFKKPKRYYFHKFFTDDSNQEEVFKAAREIEGINNTLYYAEKTIESFDKYEELLYSLYAQYKELLKEFYEIARTTLKYYNIDVN